MLVSYVAGRHVMAQANLGSHLSRSSGVENAHVLKSATPAQAAFPGKP